MERNRICPLLDGKSISEDNCYEYCLVAEKMLKPDRILPESVKVKEDFREICLSCEHHDLN